MLKTHKISTQNPEFLNFRKFPPRYLVIWWGFWIWEHRKNFFKICNDPNSDDYLLEDCDTLSFLVSMVILLMNMALWAL